MSKKIPILKLSGKEYLVDLKNNELKNTKTGERINFSEIKESSHSKIRKELKSLGFEV